MGTPEKAVSWGKIPSPLGTLFAAVSEKTAIYVSFTSENDKDFLDTLSRLSYSPSCFMDAAVLELFQELRDYFCGKRRKFTYSADTSRCTGFQRRALEAASRIPYGEVRSYAWLAQQAKSLRAARAAGQVMAKNHVPLIIPCHRVIASSGKLGGFAGGRRALDLKQFLLDLEKGVGRDQIHDFTLANDPASTNTDS